MTYGIFTTSEEKFGQQCDEILDHHHHYSGWRTLPMLEWTRHRISLRDGTRMIWIDSRKELEPQLIGYHFNRIYVLDGVSKIQLLESVYPRWNPVTVYS